MYVNKVLSEQNAFRLFAGELRNIFIVIDSAGRFKDTKKIYISVFTCEIKLCAILVLSISRIVSSNFFPYFFSLVSRILYLLRNN